MAKTKLNPEILQQLSTMDTAGLLQYLEDNDMLNLSHVQEQMEMINRKEILEQHPYSVWENEKTHKWFTYFPDSNGKRGKVKKRNSKKEIEDIIVEYWRSQIESPTIADVFKEWNDRRLETGAIIESTYTRYQQVFDRHFETFGERKIKSVTIDDFAEFLEEQIPVHQLNTKAFRNLKCITRGIIKRAKREQLIAYTADDVMHEVDTSERKFKSSVKTDADEVFTPEEMSKIIDYLSDHQDIWNLGLLILCVTGMRVGELCALHWEDVTPESIYIHRTETRYKTEDGKWIYEVKDAPKTAAGVRTAVIPQGYQWIIPAIRTLHDDEEYVFFREGERMRTSCMRKRFQRVLEKLDIPKRGLHKIRKTYCSLLFRNGLDGKQIINQMGHTDITCSEKYYHWNLASIEETLNAVSNIPEFRPKMKLIC